MNTTQLNDIVAQATTPRARFLFETLTTPKLTAKNRTTKAPTTFTVQIRSRFRADLGVNYETEVNNVLAFEGKPQDFRAQAPKGKHYVSGSNWLMQADADPNKYYVALSSVSDKTTEYLIDGRTATPAEIEDLKVNYLPKQSDKPVLVPWRTYSVESIQSMVRV